MTIARTWPQAAFLVLIASVPHAFGADAPHWQIDPARSRLGFSGTQTGVAFRGKFTRFGAAIAFDPEHLDTSHIGATVDLASASTGDVQRDAALPGSDWFDVANFPKATFETNAITRTGTNAYIAAGRLTIRGIGQPVSLRFTLDVDGRTAHAKGHAELVRTAFGVGQGPWASGQWVALEVGVDVDLVATRTD